MRSVLCRTRDLLKGLESRHLFSYHQPHSLPSVYVALRSKTSSTPAQCPEIVQINQPDILVPQPVSAHMLIHYVPQAMLTCAGGSLGESCKLATLPNSQIPNLCIIALLYSVLATGTPSLLSGTDAHASGNPAPLMLQLNCFVPILAGSVPESIIAFPAGRNMCCLTRNSGR